MTRAPRFALAAAIVLVVIGAGGLAMELLWRPVPVVAAYLKPAIGGPFALADSSGRAVTERTYRGKWLLVFFGYTHCADACPLALNKIGIALNQLGPSAVNLQPLFITIDPARDTPQAMARYLKSFDPRIVGLTGSDARIAAVAREYRVYFSPTQTAAEKDYQLDHSAFIYVMDPAGKFVEALDPDLSGPALADRLRRLLEPASKA